MHNYGLVLDFVIISDDGKRTLWTEGEKWTRVAVIAKSLGLVWGGDFELFRDFALLGMSGGLSTRNLQKGLRPNLVSRVASANSERKMDDPLFENLVTGIMWVVRRYFSGEVRYHFNNFNEISYAFKN